MITPSEAYERGATSGRRARGKLAARMQDTYRGWRAGFPAAAQLDLEREMLSLDRERLDRVPSLARFPETRGWPDLVRAERKGFADASGCSPAESAFHFNSYYFMWCRLHT